MVENSTMIPERVFLEERTVRFLLRQCSYSRQEVTLLHKLYLISSPLAMLSRKEVLTVSIDVSLEVRNAREAGSAQAVQIALFLTTHRTRWSSMRLLRFQGIRQNQQDLFIAVYLTERALRKMVQWDSLVTGSGRMGLAMPCARPQNAQGPRWRRRDQGGWTSWSSPEATWV